MTVSFDENYLLLFLKEGTAYGTQIFYAEINELKFEGADDFIPLIDTPIAEFSYVQNDGTKFFFETDYDAPFMKIIAIDLERPELEHWSDVIAEPDNSAYSYGSTVIDKTKILRLVSNDVDFVELWQLPSGDDVAEQLTEIHLPGMGSISDFAGLWNESTLLYEFSGPISPSSVYSFDIDDYSTQLLRKEEFPGYDEDLFAVDFVTYPSKDGT